MRKTDYRDDEFGELIEENERLKERVAKLVAENDKRILDDQEREKNRDKKMSRNERRFLISLGLFSVIVALIVWDTKAWEPLKWYAVIAWTVSLILAFNLER